MGYVQEFPITALSVRPLANKFADDLDHRDFPGTLMNIGIKREMLGENCLRGVHIYSRCNPWI